MLCKRMKNGYSTLSGYVKIKIIFFLIQKKVLSLKKIKNDVNFYSDELQVFENT